MPQIIKPIPPKEPENKAKGPPAALPDNDTCCAGSHGYAPYHKLVGEQLPNESQKIMTRGVPTYCHVKMLPTFSILPQLSLLHSNKTDSAIKENGRIESKKSKQNG